MSARTQVPTRAEALANAARLLNTAEDETDRGLMERYTEIALAWVSIADLATEAEGCP